MKNCQKLLSILCHQKKIIFFLCIYKMIPISKEEYENSEKQKYRQELTPNAEYQ